jgi:hypothetical protein
LRGLLDAGLAQNPAEDIFQKIRVQTDRPGRAPFFRDQVFFPGGMVHRQAMRPFEGHHAIDLFLALLEEGDHIMVDGVDGLAQGCQFGGGRMGLFSRFRSHDHVLRSRHCRFACGTCAPLQAYSFQRARSKIVDQIGRFQIDKDVTGIRRRAGNPVDRDAMAPITVRKIDALEPVHLLKSPPGRPRRVHR